MISRSPCSTDLLSGVSLASRWLLLVASLPFFALAACTGDGVPVSPQADAGSGADTDASVDAGAVDSGGIVSQIDGIIEAARAKQTPVPSLALAVYDKDDHLVYAKSFGDFAPDRRVAIASASKMVAGLVIFTVIGKGQLTLDSTTGSVLGWAPPRDTITLRHLLSFTSGMAPEAACTANPNTTLAACVETIGQTATKAAPGATFEYGSTHLHVAARMAEVATGKSWATLFDEAVKQPLGLPNDVAYFTAPRQSIGTTNPLIAGGLRTSMDEYAKILGAVFHRGGGVAAPAELFDLQTKEPFPGVAITQSPMQTIGQPFRYGLTAWLECPTPATGCATISSAGAFGFTPWLDRDTGYYAILGMQLENTKGGVVSFSVSLQQEIKPLIPSLLGK